MAGQAHLSESGGEYKGNMNAVIKVYTS